MMNNRGHLPAGQPMQGGVDNMVQVQLPVPVPVPGPGVGGVAGGGGNGNGNGGDRRSRREGRHAQHYAQHGQPHAYYQHANQYNMYQHGYMAQYAAPQSPYYMPPQYANGGMPTPSHMGYTPAAAYNNRSPPPLPQYSPLVVHGSYGRPGPHSPVVPAAYQAPPPPHAPVVAQGPIPPPHTPSSSHSSFVAPQPAPHHAMTPATSQVVENLPTEIHIPPTPHPEPEIEKKVLSPTPVPVQPQQSPLPLRPSPYMPLPWLSRPDEPFPTRTARSRRRRRVLNPGLEVLPQGGSPFESSADSTVDKPRELEVEPSVGDEDKPEEEEGSVTTPKIAAAGVVVEPPSGSETTSIQEQPSDCATSSSPTTPSSLQPATASSSIAVNSKTTKPATRSALPAVPVIPALPKSTSKESRPSTASEKAQSDATKEAEPVAHERQVNGSEEATPGADGGNASANTTEDPQVEPTPAPTPAPAKPKTWSALFTKPSASAPTVNTAVTGDYSQTNGTPVTSGSDATTGTAGFTKSNTNLLAEALGAYRVGAPDKLAFLEPRGLVNTGNMCYMNSVLQVLIFSIPFYGFLDQVSKKAAHSFKSETPLLDAMIMLMREFRVIDSAVSVDQLRRRLKAEELEQYGEPFTPEFVYEAIRNLPRFASMRRGHQQDAEEFLGFLLEGLHDECTRIMRFVQPSAASSSLPSPTSSKNGFADDDEWLEVGRRQRPAVTRQSGNPTHLTPITKIFGGRLRSELRVQGKDLSVTYEPYQPLQLDIGAPDVRNIIDALKGLTRPESLHGDFNSPRGKDARATKQVFIDSLPPVLVLHLKRFHFDAEGHGTVKIWKKVGYPLDLEIPEETLARGKKSDIVSRNAHKYRLIAVVYHHGKNASGGHYTVDVRRQDGREWVRIDDTVIRRVRSEDVAEGGAEDDSSKTLPAEARKENGNSSTVSNRFMGMNDENAGDDDGWKQAPAGGKKWSSVVNGGTPAAPANGSKAKQTKESIKDNKVAYLLFYEQI